MADRPPLRNYSHSRAVLVGTWGYEVLEAVPAAEHSLRRMAGLLTGPLCGWPAERLMLAPNEPRPGDLPDRLITAFDGITGVALFYFVGHGQIAPDDQLCLGLAQSRPEANRRAVTSLRFSDVRQALQESRAATKIVILDCCFAGLATTRAGALAGNAGNRVLDLIAGTGAYTMAATSAYATAWYEHEPRLARPQTYFTKYLADLVEKGIPGQPSRLHLEAIFRQLRDNLTTDLRPDPLSRAVDDAHEFAFAYNAAPPEAQRDPERELTHLTRRLAVSDAQVRALEVKAAGLSAELEDLRQQAASSAFQAPRQQREIQDAIGQATRRLDDALAARAARAYTTESKQEQSRPTPPAQQTSSQSSRKTTTPPGSRPAGMLPRPMTAMDGYTTAQPAKTPGHPTEGKRSRPSSPRPIKWHRPTLILSAAAATALTGLIIAMTTPGFHRPPPTPTPSASPADCASGTLTLDGSAFGSIAQQAAIAYRSRCKNAHFKFGYGNGKDSAWGAGQLENAVNDPSKAGSMIAMYDGTTTMARGLTAHPIGMFIYSVVARTGLYRRSDITLKALKQLFDEPGCVPGKLAVGLQAGSATRLALLGLLKKVPSDPNSPGLCSPPSGHSTENTYEGALGMVSGTSNAIGYMAVDGIVDGHLEIDGHPTNSPNVSVLSIEGVAPTPGNVHDGSYHFAAVENLYTVPHPSQLAQSFLAYLPDYLAKHQVPDFITCSNVPVSMAAECPAPR
jgi:hypothetical protein